MEEKELEKILDMNNNLYKKKVEIRSLVEDTFRYSSEYEKANTKACDCMWFGIIVLIVGLVNSIDWVRNVGIGMIVLSLIAIPNVINKEKELKTKKHILEDYIFGLQKKEE